MLAILGTLNVLSTALAGFVGTSAHGPAEDIGGIVLAFLVNLVLFGAAFRILTAAELDWGELWPGVILAAVFWQLLQHLGGFYVAHTLKHTQELYGFFALVLGLIAWLYLGAQLTILAAEVNVVRARRLWPRSFLSPPLLDADKRTLSALARDRGARPRGGCRRELPDLGLTNFAPPRLPRDARASVAAYPQFENFWVTSTHTQAPMASFSSIVSF